jgi:Sugar phosphate isomerases/epimerases
MKLALNGATTMHASLETDIKAASSAGFELLEIWASKLRSYLKTNTPTDLKRLLDEWALQPYSINSIEHITFRTPEDYEKIKAECEDLSTIAGEISCPYVVVVPGKLPENATRARSLTSRFVC